MAGTCWSFPASNSRPSPNSARTSALALNVTQNHLDRHHTFENYAAAKGRLFETQRAGDFAVLNAEDPVCVGYAARTAAAVAVVQRRGARCRPAPSLRGEKLVLDGEPADGGRRDSHSRAPQRGERAGGVDRGGARRRDRARRIAAAVRTFQAVEHRLEFVRKVSGIDFYNDSKATSVDATLKALDAFPGGLWVILGGKDKGLDYSRLREPLAAKARAALLIGAAAAKIAGQLRGRRCRWWMPGRWMPPWRYAYRSTAGRAIPCCWRRPAPASTSSGASNIAARFSSRSSTDCEPKD